MVRRFVPPEPNIPEDTPQDEREKIVTQWHEQRVILVEVKPERDGVVDWDAAGEVAAFDALEPFTDQIAVAADETGGASYSGPVQRCLQLGRRQSLGHVRQAREKESLYPLAHGALGRAHHLHAATQIIQRRTPALQRVTKRKEVYIMAPGQTGN